MKAAAMSLFLMFYLQHQHSHWANIKLLHATLS